MNDQRQRGMSRRSAALTIAPDYAPVDKRRPIAVVDPRLDANAGKFPVSRIVLAVPEAFLGDANGNLYPRFPDATDLLFDDNLFDRIELFPGGGLIVVPDFEFLSHFLT